LRAHAGEHASESGAERAAAPEQGHLDAGVGVTGALVVDVQSLQLVQTLWGGDEETWRALL